MSPSAVAGRPLSALLVLLSLVPVACASVTSQPGGAGGQPAGTGGRAATGGAGSGATGGAGGQGAIRGGMTAVGGAGDENCSHELRLAARDFRGNDQDGKPKHPDFEQVIVDDRGMVAALLGADSKPVYAGNPMTPTTTGKANFDQWYRDVDGVNIRVDSSIVLTPDPARPGVYVYDNDKFFPLDKLGWPDPYADHNHDFTAEMHFTFPYRGGEVFNFRGDDDVFVFVNGHLAIDLGGIHSAQMGTIDLDAKAAEFGIAPGGAYQMDIFYADRHCCDSTFHIETTFQCVTNIVIP